MLLQFGVEQAYTDYLIHLAITLVAMMLALYIVFQAFRGYQRNDSQRILFLAIGLSLLTLAPFALSILGASLDNSLGLGPRLYTFYLPVASRLLEICGLGCILYSLFIHD